MSKVSPARTPRTSAAAESIPIAAAWPGRASWCGFLRLRRLVIPVKGYPMTSVGHEVELHQLHVGCGQRVRQQRYCPEHGPLEAQEIVKGYEHAEGQYVVVTDDDLERLRRPTGKMASIEQFLDAGEIDPARYSGRSLALLPDGPAARRAYAVLAEALRRQHQWGLGRAFVAGRPGPVILRRAGPALALDLLHPPDRLRAPAQRPEAVAVGGEELHLAEQLVRSTTGPVHWEGYQDDMPEKFAALVEAKLQGRQVVPLPSEEVVVLSVREALERSLATARAVRRPQARKTNPRPPVKSREG